MVEEVKESPIETAPVVEAVDALPEVPAVAATPDVPAVEAVEEVAVAAPEKSKRGRPRKVQPTETAAIAAVKPAKLPKPVKTKPAAKKARPAKPLPVAAAPAVPAVKPAIKRPSTAPNRAKSPSVKPFVGTAKAPTIRKELFAMATPTEYTEKMQAAFKDAQEKAKAAFGDAGSFAKGNVEAMVESTKILAAGLQDMTKGYVAESKTSIETLTADVKDLAAVKSPTEFFEKQSALMRKNFDAAVAVSSKNSEAMLKLVSEAFQPISTRVSLAVEKIKHAA